MIVILAIYGAGLLLVGAITVAASSDAARRRNRPRCHFGERGASW